MGVIDKVKFWKKDDPIPPQPEPPAYDLGAQHLDSPDPFAKPGMLNPDPMQSPQGPMQNDPFSQHQEPDTFGHEVFGRQANYPMGTAQFPGRQQVQEPLQETAIHPRDVELILAKLDAIKSELDALHQRVRKLEQVADNQTQPSKRYW